MSTTHHKTNYFPIPFGNGVLHLSADDELRLFVQTKLAAVFGKHRGGRNEDTDRDATPFPEYHELVRGRVPEPPRGEYFVSQYVPAGRRWIVFMTRQITTDRDRKPVNRKLCLLVNDAYEIMTSSIVADSEYFKDTVLDCIFNSESKTMYVIDVHWYCGDKCRRDTIERQLLGGMAALILNFEGVPKRGQPEPAFAFKSQVWNMYHPTQLTTRVPHGHSLVIASSVSNTCKYIL